MANDSDANVQVTLQYPQSMATPIAFEVLNSELDRVAEGTLSPDKEHVQLQLPPGAYQAVASGGHRYQASRSFRLEPGEITKNIEFKAMPGPMRWEVRDVALDKSAPQQSPQKWNLQELEEAARRSYRLPELTLTGASPDADAGERTRQQSMTACWLRAFAVTPDQLTWKCRPVSNAAIAFQDWKSVVHVPRDELYLLQAGAEGAPIYHVMLPPGSTWVFRVAAPPLDQDIDAVLDAGAMQLALDMPKLAADPLLDFMNSGDFAAARRLESAALAEELLFGKQADPLSAAIGAYYLLRTGDYERLHDWSRNLASWFPWLPDGAVVHAWWLIRARAAPFEEVRPWLLEAWRRGMPLYAEGLRLLSSATLLYREQQKVDEQWGKIANHIGYYAAALAPNLPVTTFFGATPESPSAVRARATAPPQDESTVFLKGA